MILIVTIHFRGSGLAATARTEPVKCSKLSQFARTGSLHIFGVHGGILHSRITKLLRLTPLLYPSHPAGRLYSLQYLCDSWILYDTIVARERAAQA